MKRLPEIQVFQLPKFRTEANKLLGTEGIEELCEFLVERPECGDLIPGSGGIRKMRWAAKGKGKRGGARVVYLYVQVASRIYLLSCYSKNMKTDLTQEDKKRLRQIAAELKGLR